MKRIGASAALALLAAGAAMVTAPAARAQTQSQDQAGATEPDRGRMVCRNLTPTGSRMSRRICRTQAEWDRSRDRTQEEALREQLGPGTTYEQATPR